MSNYKLVTTLHAARVTLADARKAGDAAAVAAAEAEVAAARAAVTAALADGRVASAAHLLDLDLDALGAILSHLGPEDALRVARTCIKLRSALFRGGLPAPLATACGLGGLFCPPDVADAAVHALGAMEPALGATRLTFEFGTFCENRARVLARALDAAPRAARVDIVLPHRINADQTGLLADVLSSPDRKLAAPPQVHMTFDEGSGDALLCLTRAGVCVATLSHSHGAPDAVLPIAASTLTTLQIDVDDMVNLTGRFPALRLLILSLRVRDGRFATDVPPLTALAPCLQEVQFDFASFSGRVPTGFGFEPGPFARFLAGIQGVTRVVFGNFMHVSLLQNENANLGQLTALRSLRDLEMSCRQAIVEVNDGAPIEGGTEANDGNPPHHVVVPDDAVTNLPPLPPGLTRLAFSGPTRVAFRHPLPELRVLDWRGADEKVDCAIVESDDRWHTLVKRRLRVPLAVPSAAIAPNLHTLLINFTGKGGAFDLWTLVAARTALRVVVIERARLLCDAPRGTDKSAAGMAKLLARESKDLVSVHVHGCKPGRKPAVQTFFRALKERGVRMCRAGVGKCMFCMLHDGADFWPQIW